MEESILRSTKKSLNIAMDDDSFDHDIAIYINSALSHLQQLGIGPEAGFIIEDTDEAEGLGVKTWQDFLPDASPAMVSLVKTNVYLRVRLVFDPPQLPHLLSALERQLLESDSRLSMLREETEWTNPDPGPMVVDGGDPGD